MMRDFPEQTFRDICRASWLLTNAENCKALLPQQKQQDFMDRAPVGLVLEHEDSPALVAAQFRGRVEIIINFEAFFPYVAPAVLADHGRKQDVQGPHVLDLRDRLGPLGRLFPGRFAVHPFARMGLVGVVGVGPFVAKFLERGRRKQQLGRFGQLTFVKPLGQAFGEGFPVLDRLAFGHVVPDVAGQALEQPMAR